jgi:hypothetical protein
MSGVIDKRHRYLIRNAAREYVGSTDDLGFLLPDGHIMVDTLGEDDLGTLDGRRGIPDFLRAKARGQS